MNIYDYFNSRDVAEYCKKVNHIFSAVEMAYIVWRSENHTLLEKHIAWQEIIDTMPDETFSTWTTKLSLHDFLKNEIQAEKMLIKDFCTTKENCVYLYSFGEEEEELFYTSAEIYNNFDECLKDASEELEDESFIAIRRRSLKSADHDFDDELWFNKNHEVYMYRDYRDFDIGINHEMFSMMHRCTNIPINFKRGDIIAARSDIYGECFEPVVLDEIKTKESGIWTYIYQIRDGNIKKFVGPNYLDLQYYNGEFSKETKILEALSKYLKDENDIADLIRFCRQYQNN